MTSEPDLDPTADAVRRYLAWIDDPDSAVDQDALAAAQALLAEAEDPLDRLHAAAAVERASAADGSALEAAFVAHAASYAAANEIPVAAFRALGVGDDVLARAGFAVAPSRAGAADRAPRRAPAGGPRSPQVPTSRIKAVAGQMPKRFTLAQLADQAGGGSPATVRKAVEELIAEGRVRKLGPATDHSGPGRAPTLYELV